MVSENLQTVVMPYHLLKFYETKDEDPSRYMERLARLLVTNPRYWLVWFPITMEGEAHKWYKKHGFEGISFIEAR